MATTDEIRSLLQTQATQSINPFMRGLSLLTGGLAGEFTGTNEDIRNREFAKRALMEQNIKDLEEERAIKRQAMENALRLKTSAAGEGLGMLPGATQEEVLANYMEARKRKDIGTEAALTASLGRTPQGMALLTNRADPAFQAGFRSANLETLGKESEAAVQEKIQRPKVISQLAGYGIQASPETPTGQLTSMLRQAELKAQSQIPTQMRQEDDKANVIDLYAQYPGLQAFGGRSDADMQNLPASAAKSILKRANDELDKTKTLQNKEAQASAFTRTMGILNLPFDQRTTPENLQALYADSALVGKAITDSPKWQAAIGLGPKLEAKELDNVKSYAESLQVGNNFAKLLADVAKQPGGLKKFQENNFGTIANAINTKGSKFFESDAERELARALVQEYEAFRQGPRKTLFGASLTSGEQESANISFGTPTDKDFFNRAIQFIDRVQQNDPVTFYLDAGKSINEPVVSKIIAQKKAYNDYRSSFYPTLKPSSKVDRLQDLKQQAEDIRKSLGATNTPAINR
jgi:hypothetical protein